MCIILPIVVKTKITKTAKQIQKGNEKMYNKFSFELIPTDDESILAIDKEIAKL
jgi:seryl-tRNA synthetase